MRASLRSKPMIRNGTELTLSGAAGLGRREGQSGRC